MNLNLKNLNENDHPPEVNLALPTIYYLNDQQYDHFVKAMNEPREPTPEMLRGIELYKRIVKSRP